MLAHKVETLSLFKKLDLTAMATRYGLLLPIAEAEAKALADAHGLSDPGLFEAKDDRPLSRCVQGEVDPRPAHVASGDIHHAATNYRPQSPSRPRAWRPRHLLNEGFPTYASCRLEHRSPALALTLVGLVVDSRGRELLEPYDHINLDIRLRQRRSCRPICTPTLPLPLADLWALLEIRPHRG